MTPATATTEFHTARTKSVDSPVRALGQLVLLLLFYTAVTCVLFWPLLAHLSTVLIGPPEDNLNDFWNSWYAVAGADPRHFFETNLVRYPEGASLYYQSFAYPQLAVMKLLAALFGGAHARLVLWQNITLLASFALAGAGGFFLVRRFTGHIPASLLGGYVFAFNPAHVAQAMHHIGIAQIGFLPFFVLAWLTALEKRSPAWLAGATLFFVLSALCCWYYLFYLLYFMLFHTAWRAWRLRRLPERWELFALAACLAGSAVLLSPLLVPMIAQAGTPGAYAGGSDLFVADALGFFLFSPTHPLGRWTGFFYTMAGGNPWEATVYLGLVNLALIGWLVRRRPAVDDPASYLLCGIALFVLLAAGDTLHLLGQSLYIPLPNLALSHLPFLANARVPARAIVLAYLFLSIAVGYALAVASREWRGRWARPALAAIAALVVLDFMPTGVETTPAVCPPELAIIAQDPARDFGVLNLPLGTIGKDMAMFQQTCHGRPVVAASIARTLRQSLIDRLDLSDRTVLRRQLREAHTKYIVLDDRLAWSDDAPPKLRVVVGDRFPYIGFVRSANPVQFAPSGHFPWISGTLSSPPAAAKISKEQFRKDYPIVARSPEMTVLRVY